MWMNLKLKKGIISIEDDFICKRKYVDIEIGGFHFEVLVPNKLLEIKSVLEFDSEGYFVLDTNYGEEYLDVGNLISSLNLNSMDVKGEFNMIQGFWHSRW